MMPCELDLKNNALVNADWRDSDTTYVGLLLPNFFILYFGQKLLTGDIMWDDVKMAFLKVARFTKSGAPTQKKPPTPPSRLQWY
jgi:hypothetical protein